MSQTDTMPSRLQEIVADFQFLEGEEKLQLLLEFSEEMAPLPEGVSPDVNMEQIHECMTPVFVHSELQDGGMQFYFDVPRESPTVRGYASILGQGLNGETPEAVINMPGDFYMQMGLNSVLSGQRLNGMRAIVAYLKRLATDALAQKN